MPNLPPTNPSNFQVTPSSYLVASSLLTPSGRHTAGWTPPLPSSHPTRPVKRQFRLVTALLGAPLNFVSNHSSQFCQFSILSITLTEFCPRLTRKLYIHSNEAFCPSRLVKKIDSLLSLYLMC